MSTNPLHEIATKFTKEELLNVLDNINDALYLTIISDDQQIGPFIEVNRAACELLGYSRQELLQLTPLDIIDFSVPVDLEKEQTLLLNNETFTTESVHIAKDGTKIPVEVSSRAIQLHNGQQCILSTARDISLQKEAERLLKESEERYKSLFDYNIDAVVTFDIKGNFVQINKATETLMGYTAEELLHKPFLPFIAPEEQQRTLEQFSIVLSGRPHQYETVIVTRNKKQVFMHVTVIPIFIREQLSGVHCIAKDITEKKRTELRINYMAYHDALTNLGNQRLFHKDLKTIIKNAANNQHPFSVFFLDLDRFKFINDYLGHDMGDLLLQKVAARLKKCVGPLGTIYRQGGDEFFILIQNASHEQAKTIAEQIVKDISEPYDLRGFEAIITVSLGISKYPEDGLDAKILMKKADNAMYHAKRLGKNNYQFYYEHMQGFVQNTLKIETLLRKALEKNEFFLLYQPQIDAVTNQICGIEALIRWQNEELGIVSPADFIPIAEETGLIIPIGEWVIREACQQNKQWQQHGAPKIPISINLSIRQFYQADLIHTIAQILEETALEPQYLELEITETMAMEADIAIQILQQLKEIGIKIAIDDFGTGYSSLNYLRRFPIDHLKIDRSFVNDIHSTSDDRDIIATIIALGSNLNMRVIAEGVETIEQVDYLKKYKCDMMQGYYYSRPVPASEICALFNKFS